MTMRSLRRSSLLGLASLTVLLVVRGAQATSCCPGDVNGDHVVTIDEILHAVNAALNGCASVPVPCQGGALLSTGQIQCDQGSGTLGACPGSPPGQDAAVRAGAPLSYVDNGDGTITDKVTGLMWEKLLDDGSIHDWDNAYSWSDAFGKIAVLNMQPCFTGHCDWRLPNRRELESLIDMDRVKPASNPVFDSACEPGCDVTSCSCTQLTYYWSSTTYQDPGNTDNAWAVNFSLGDVNANLKIPDNQYGVRAVRGGL
jgi:hypothetical protein